jgi:hypothetical protein
MKSEYQLAGYYLCGHIVPTHLSSALDQYLDNNPALRDEAEGRIARAGRDLSSTMAEASEKLLSGWLEIERLLLSLQEGEVVVSMASSVWSPSAVHIYEAGGL